MDWQTVRIDLSAPHFEIELFQFHTYTEFQNRFFLFSTHPEIASFGPNRCSRSFEILDVAGYACFAGTVTLPVSNSLRPWPEPTATISG